MNREKLRQEWQASFENIDWRRPIDWPSTHQFFLYCAIACTTSAVGWFLFLAEPMANLEAAQLQEVNLQQAFDSKLKSVAHLRSLQQLRGKIKSELELLERQLPEQSEIDQLLSSINQAGLNRNLQFELFRPAPILTKDHYAELPISIRLAGKYADIGLFVADVAHLPRVVAMSQMQISQKNDKPDRIDNILVFEATAKTYRTLNAVEILEKNKAKEGKK